MNQSESTASGRRVIKRYSNRKLYDTKDSRYVTLLEIAELIRNGEDVQVIDNATKADKTDITLALIISEELKNRHKGIPLSTLRSLVRQRGERLLSQLRDGPIGRLVPRDSEPAECIPSPGSEVGSSPPEGDPGPSAGATRGIRATFEQWQQVLDERIGSVVAGFSDLSELRREVRELAERVSRIEASNRPKS